MAWKSLYHFQEGTELPENSFYTRGIYLIN